MKVLVVSPWLTSRINPLASIVVPQAAKSQALPTRRVESPGLPVRDAHAVEQEIADRDGVSPDKCVVIARY
jgi:hypothetical protein